MGIKIQFNESTGKVAYTSGTGKVQVSVVSPVGPCALCVLNSPDQIEVTLSDFVVSCCAGTGGSSGKSRVWDTAIESIVNGTHILDHLQTCAWVKFFDIDVDILDYESASDCTGTPVLRNYTTLQMTYSVSPVLPSGCQVVVSITAFGDGVTSNTLLFARNSDDTICFNVIDSHCMPLDTLVAGSACNYASAVRVIDGTIAVAEV